MSYFVRDNGGTVELLCLAPNNDEPEGWTKVQKSDIPEEGIRSCILVDGSLVVDPEKDAENYTAKQRRNRANEYPPIGDQLDEIMKWLSTETEFGIPPKLKSIAGLCMSVKSKYPLTRD